MRRETLQVLEQIHAQHVSALLRDRSSDVNVAGCAAAVAARCDRER
jgi:hypothetical protein